MINRIDNFNYNFSSIFKVIIMIFSGLILTESRLDEITFPDMQLARLRPGFGDTVRVKMCKLCESARVEFQFF